jgi:hypothetical protein
MNYTIEMALDSMKFLPTFMKLITGIQSLFGGVWVTDTHTQQGDLISLLLFFQNKKSRLKIFH